jgi:hypothetical protein
MQGGKADLFKLLPFLGLFRNGFLKFVSGFFHVLLQRVLPLRELLKLVLVLRPLFL